MDAKGLVKLCDGRCEAKHCVYGAPIFSHLDHAEMQKISALIKRKTYPPKTAVFL